MAQSTATAAFGTLLKVGDGGGPEAFTTLAEVTSISGPALSMDTIDVTHMESPDDFREMIPSFKSGGEVTVELNFLPANATQDATTGILADFNSRTLRNFQIVWTDAGNTTWAFSAYVTGFEPSAPVDDKLSASMTLTISGNPTLG